MANLIKGENLTPNQIGKVKAAFVHRNTFENAANSKRLQPLVKLISDEQWIREHAFYFNKGDNELSGNRRHCEPAFLAD